MRAALFCRSRAVGNPLARGALEPLKNDHGNRTRTTLCFACVLKLESRHVLFSKIHENVEVNRC